MFQVWWLMPLISALWGGAKASNLCESKASLVFIVGSRIPRAMKREVVSTKGRDGRTRERMTHR